VLVKEGYARANDNYTTADEMCRVLIHLVLCRRDQRQGTKKGREDETEEAM